MVKAYKLKPTDTNTVTYASTDRHGPKNNIQHKIDFVHDTVFVSHKALKASRFYLTVEHDHTYGVVDQLVLNTYLGSEIYKNGKIFFNRFFSIFK